MVEPDKKAKMQCAIVLLRVLFVFINNLYCIPVHVIWLLCLYPVKWLAEPLYWKIEGILFKWLLSMVAFWSYSAGYNVVELGDDISDFINEKSLLMFNHQSTSDVPLIMAAFNSRESVPDNIMWIMDKLFKKTNFGVVSLFHGDFFISAGKEHRSKSLEELSHHLREFYIPRHRKWIVLFPEGGFLKNRKSVSQKYAQKNNLPVLENVSLPRVGALKIIFDEVGHKKHNDGVKYLIDVTIAYPNGKPIDLLTIVGGYHPPCDIIFYYEIIPVEKIPQDEGPLTNWLYEQYYEKEKILQKYYDTGVFIDSKMYDLSNPPANYKNSRVLHDPLLFVLRHGFFIASTILWLRILLWFVSFL